MEQAMNIKMLIAAAVIAGLPASATADHSALGCFARVYDRAHLARHPDQTVTAVRLKIMKPDRRTSFTYNFALAFKVRGRNVSLKAEGPCIGKQCIVECDGGGVRIAPHADHMMMHLDRIRVTAACGDLDGEELSGGKDDRVFRLERMNDEVCDGR
jgi:hypothetical protein